ncbi:DNA replication and repair protein RecO [Pseudidiomarina indica]|uniref:DNA repair protein RecO n=1 Tax=Pseudidiomarina indica TaxID=1159017 RepID=A0A1G6ACQ6_9GAMM|nr:DNA repair protein RecO [Pseudidiomarina indica]SDB06096.1 DNA replication and repair protein RecO [Pseudidiomarina indica]
MSPAFVLHRWPYQDTSLLLELFTPEHGRFRAIAKGAKRAKSPWRSILQPFIPLQIETRGRHELQTLVSAEALALAFPLQGIALYSAFYVNELIQRLTTPYHANEQLFRDYQQTLELLTKVEQVEPILRRFEWQLLCHLGHGFDWVLDTSGNPIQSERTYQFMPEAGFELCLALPASGPSSVYRGADILRLAEFDVAEPRLLVVFKRIMRMALQPYLGAQPLRSREFFLQYKEMP